MYKGILVLAISGYSIIANRVKKSKKKNAKCVIQTMTIYAVYALDYTSHSLKPRYNKQVRQTLNIHDIE